MKITLFKAVTTEEVIAAFEEDAKTYDGLYVDMNNKDERKFVKDNGALINDTRKKLDRARIDLTKQSKKDIDAEFKLIDDRLIAANEPFDSLLDAYKVERKKILDAEKAAAQAIIDAEELDRDHEFALLLNKTWEHDQAELARKQAEHEAAMAEQAAQRERDMTKQLAEAKERDRIAEENARLANREYVAGVNRKILAELTKHGLSDEHAKLVIRLAVHNKLPQLSIQY